MQRQDFRTLHISKVQSICVRCLHSQYSVSTKALSSLQVEGTTSCPHHMGVQIVMGKFPLPG